MSQARRRAPWALALALGASVALTGLAALPVAAEGEEPTIETLPIDSAPVVENCVVNYNTVGASLVLGQKLEVPYPNLAGGPYVETEMNAIPKTRALASNAHEGNLGEIVLGTSGVYPESPTQSLAFYPPVEGNQKSNAEKNNAPLAKTSAQADSGRGMAWAEAGRGEFGDQVSMGPSYAQSQVTFDGKVLKGADEAWGYNLKLGGAVISNLRSTINYQTDGTAAGSKADWKIEFFGIRNGDAPMGSFTGEGISIQGGQPQPGNSGREQFNAGAKQLADALEAAKIGRVEVTVQPGSVTTGEGDVAVQGSGLEIRVAPEASKGSTVHAVSVIFGHQERIAEVDLGACFGGVETPAEPVAVEVPPSDSGLLPSVLPSSAESYTPEESSTDLVDVGSGYGSADTSGVPEPAVTEEAAAPSASALPSAPKAAVPIAVTQASAVALRRGYTWALVLGLAGLAGLAALWLLALAVRPRQI
jgi:hypothetical protein